MDNTHVDIVTSWINQLVLSKITYLRRSRNSPMGTLRHTITHRRHFQTNKLRTRTVAGTVDPDFSETLTYCNVPAEVVATSTLWISVLGESRRGVRGWAWSDPQRPSDVTVWLWRIVYRPPAVTQVCERGRKNVMANAKAQCLLSNATK